MNDDFLYQVQPPIPPGLEDRVRERITAVEDRSGRAWGTPKAFRGGLAWWNEHKILALLGVLLLLAACAAGIIKIGGFVLQESPKSPGRSLEAQLVPQRTVSRREALAALTFEVGMPSWVPEGYELSDRAMVTLPEEESALSEAWQVWLYWEGSGGKEILLLAYPSAYYRNDPLAFGPESMAEIKIRGSPAVAVRGNWERDGKVWNEAAGGNVLWVQEETAYWLQSTWIGLEELVRMAQSMQ